MNLAALEDLVRLCVQLAGHGSGHGRSDPPDDDGGDSDDRGVNGDCEGDAGVGPNLPTAKEE